MIFKDFKLNSDGLMPVIVQDYKNKEVLMMAYMNKEAFDMTVETSKVHYYSRSRQCLWLKGETSGNYQILKSMTADCDNDTLLLKVEQKGVACHTGAYSCFFKLIDLKNKEFSDPINNYQNSRLFLESLYNVVVDRKNNPKEDSYTNYLFDEGIDKILKKVGEEASEVIIGAKNSGNSEVKYEIADLIYHLTVLMVEKKVNWKDIFEELEKRK